MKKIQSQKPEYKAKRAPQKRADFLFTKKLSALNMLIFVISTLDSINKCGFKRNQK